MRDFLLVAFLLLFSCLHLEGKRKAAEKSSDEFDIYILIGQSNMSGRGAVLEKDKDVMDGVFLLNDRNEIIPAKNPLNLYSSVRKKAALQKMNPGASFARDIHKATGRKVLLVVNARGGTSARMWLKNGGCDVAAAADDLFPAGSNVPSLYEETVRRAETAMRYGKVKGILWHQGEADAYEKYAPQWLDKVASIARDLRFDLKLGDEVPFIAGETLHNFKNCGYINPEIRNVRKMIPGSDWVSADGCNSNSDNVHFSRQGTTLLGHRYARKILQMVYGFTAAAAFAACTDDYQIPYSPAPADNEAMYTLCDFDYRSVEFGEANARFCVVPNPKADETNPSGIVGKVVLNGGTWDCVGCTPTFPLDFTAGATKISLKVIAPREGASVSLKLMPARSGLTEAVIVSAGVKSAGQWERLDFDLSAYKDKSNLLKKIYIMFDGGQKVRGTWYFDDLLIPDDDISDLSLFKRREPHLVPDKNKAWMCNSIANPEIITPDKSLDGRWWLLVRGGDSKRSHNGYFTQETSSFNPYGPWDDNEYNPVIPAGFNGERDSWQAIDPCGITEKGTFYYYYKGISSKNVSSVLIASTTDGKSFNKIEKPWKDSCGVATVLKWQDKYYLYVARRMYVYDDILCGDKAVEYEIIKNGGAPSNCDWYSVNGGKICRIDGRWFLFYQAGVTNKDFPSRFHVAWSDDLLNWTKVSNRQPLFTRGPRGAWDQGAIWAPSVFEYKDTLYMYYEGWGSTGEVANRDYQYFLPGHSEIGIASCSKTDFLKWCGMND